MSHRLFALNFLGLTVTNFQRSFDFYTRVLGIESTRSSPGWAWFETRGMMFELFGEAEASGDQTPSTSTSNHPARLPLTLLTIGTTSSKPLAGR